MYTLYTLYTHVYPVYPCIPCIPCIPMYTLYTLYTVVFNHCYKQPLDALCCLFFRCIYSITQSIQRTFSDSMEQWNSDNMLIVPPPMKSAHVRWSLIGGSSVMLNIQTQCWCKVSFDLVRSCNVASLIFRLSHLGLTENQKRWLVIGIALNKILVPQIRPFVEQEVDKEYNNLKTSHNIHTQSTSHLQWWPPRKFLKYENINGNSRHPKLHGGKYNFSLFDFRVSSHIDFAKLYIENFMAKFSAFDDQCDSSAVLTLLGGVPVFSATVQAAAGDVRRVTRNDWAHCVFSKWDPVKFQQSFSEMKHLVRVMALPSADEKKILEELKDWETKGTILHINII